jgi:hypothetical protein
MHNSDIDPDDLMKKPKVHYRKDSVCYKLNEILKKSSRNSNLRPKSNAKKLFYTCDDGEDNFDIDNGNEDIEEEIDPELELYNEDDNDAEVDFDENANNEVNETNMEEETVSDEDENATSEGALTDAKEMEQNLVFYKRLLHSRGFQFMDENYVLEKQAYIT